MMKAKCSNILRPACNTSHQFHHTELIPRPHQNDAAPIAELPAGAKTQPCCPQCCPTRLPAMSVNTFMADLNATYTPGVNDTAGVGICIAMGGCAEAPAAAPAGCGSLPSAPNLFQASIYSRLSVTVTAC